MATQHEAAFALSQYPVPSFTDFDDGVCNLQRKTALQLQTLENLYSGDKHPTQSRMEDYSSALGLTYELVKRWFIERRRRDKRDAARTQGGNGLAGSMAKRKSKTRNKKNVSNLAAGKDDNGRRGPFPLQDMLYSPDYILTKVFRKNGPPLGLEFASLPSTAFQGHCGIPDVFQAACQNKQRALKRRKMSKNALLESEQRSQAKTPVKKHGMGKGLMSVLQLVNSQASTRDTARASKGRKVLSCKNNSPAKKHGMGKGLMTVLQLANRDFENVQARRPQRRKPVIRKSLRKSMQQKKMPPLRLRMGKSIQHENQKACRGSCELALYLSSHEENLSSFNALEDDEELEMRELQAGPNPLTCSAHFTIGGTHGCSLCKGLLPKFPPDSIGMTKPLSRHPWNSSLELVKKLFKAFHFLYTYAVTIDVCPFTFDEFAQAFHEKNSLLLGKLHMCLLGFLLSDIEKELSNDLSIRSSKNCLFLNLLYSAKNRKFIVNFWRTSLNPLTWAEILRQVLVAAGFGSKDGISKKGCLDKV